MSLRKRLQADPDDSDGRRIAKLLGKLLVEGGLFLVISGLVAAGITHLGGSMTVVGHRLTGPAAGAAVLLFLAKRWCFLTADQPF